MPAKLDDIVSAVELMNDGDSAVLGRKSGKIYYQYTFDPTFNDKLPKNVDDETKYIWLPDKRELGLGKPLAMAFAQEVLPQDFEDVRDIFSRRGAYQRFGALIARRGVRDRWHTFANEATRRAVRTWCEDNEVTVID